MNRYPPLPQEIADKIAKARRLEWWTLFWLVTIIFVMFMVMGSSQAMQAAWIEDTLSLLPPILFLIAARLERMPPSPKYPFGLHRIGTLAFALSAAALSAAPHPWLACSFRWLLARLLLGFGKKKFLGTSLSHSCTHHAPRTHDRSAALAPSADEELGATPLREGYIKRIS